MFRAEGRTGPASLGDTIGDDDGRGFAAVHSRAYLIAGVDEGLTDRPIGHLETMDLEVPNTAAVALTIAILMAARRSPQLCLQVS